MELSVDMIEYFSHLLPAGSEEDVQPYRRMVRIADVYQAYRRTVVRWKDEYIWKRKYKIRGLSRMLTWSYKM